MLEEHVQRLTSDLELPPCVKDKKSSYDLILAEDLRLALVDLKEHIGIEATVAQVPTSRCEEAFMRFMQGNLLGQGTGAQYLGIDSDEKFLTLSCVIPYDMDYGHFKEHIEDFVNYLDYWRMEVQKLQNADRENIL